MDVLNIQNLLKEHEGQNLEFKNYQQKLNPDIYETLCAFANREGGNIFIGIDDRTRKIIGVPDTVVDQMKKDFTNGVANPEKIFPRLTYELNETKIDGKTILYTTIYPSAEVHKLNGSKIIDRQHDADIDITNTPDLVSSLYLRKKDGYSENKIYPFASIDDLNEELINIARKYAVLKNNNHPWGLLDNKELLKSAGLYLTNHLTGESGYTLACILLFGKDETIMSVCPQHRTDLIKRVNNLDRYDDRDDIRTNLIDTYFRMMKFIEKHLDAGFALDEQGVRYSPRDLLFREAIANSIIHREYRERTVATMVIEKERVVFENGCIPYRHGTITLNNFQPKSKNPRIAYVFNNMGLADELGSGVRNMYKYNEIYSKAAPTFIEGEVFKTVVPLVSNTVLEQVNVDTKALIIQHIKTHGFITTNDAMEISNLRKTRIVELLNELLEEKIILRIGSGPKTQYTLK